MRRMGASFMTDKKYVRDDALSPREQVQRIAASDAWVSVEGNPNVMQINLGKLTVDERNQVINDFSGPPIAKKQHYVIPYYDAARMKNTIAIGEISGTDGEEALMVPMELYRAIRRSTPFLTAEQKKEYQEPVPALKPDTETKPVIKRTNKVYPRKRAALDGEEELLVPGDVRATLAASGVCTTAETLSLSDIRQQTTPNLVPQEKTRQA